MTDEDLWRLNRGGHDPHKVYAAYAAAVKHTGQPTVILAKTVKGYGMGVAGEGQNITHSQKKMGEVALKAFRDRFNIPIPDEQLNATPFYKPPADSPELKYMQERRQALGGYLPARFTDAPKLKAPPLESFKALLEGSGKKEMSTTMAFVRLLTTLIRDKELGKFVVPIIPDEARTFGMEGMFRQLGIYSSVGQLYTPVDSDQVMYYREDKKGQILQEGINEAGAMSSWIAAATSYSNHGISMIRSMSITQCLAFSASVILRGRRVTCRRAVSSSAVPPVAPLWRVRGCSIRMVTAICRRRRFQTVSLTIRPSPMRWRWWCRTHSPYVPGAGECLLLHHRDE